MVFGGAILRTVCFEKRGERDCYVLHSCLRICHAGQGRIDALKLAKPPKTAGQRVYTPQAPYHPRLAVQAGHSAAVRSDVKEEAAGRGDRKSVV